MQRICDNISSGLKHAAAAHGDLSVILVWGKTYKNKDECSNEESCGVDEERGSIKLESDIS